MPSRARALPRPWYGLDTERDSQTGEFVCAWTVGENGAQKVERLEDYGTGTYWIWNLNYDLEGLLRDLRVEEAWAARADGAPFPLLDGSAIYYHGKRFTLKRPGAKVNMLEASSFFNRCRLADIGPKRTDLVDSSKMSLQRYLADATYRENVDTYCIQDARIVYDAMNDLEAGVQTLGVTLGSTPGGTARRFLARLGPFPRIIWSTHKEFLRSYCGGRFEVTKRGVLEDVCQYDIVSAYPWALSNCPWLTDSATPRLSRRFSDNALYGTYLVGFQTDGYLGIAPRWRGGVRVYSKAQAKTWLARPEVEYLLKRGVDVTIHRGLEIFDENAGDLWREIVTGLFDQKTRGGKAPQGRGAKVTLNSQYGILIQLVRRSGKWVPLAEAQSPVDFAGTLALEEPPKSFEGGKYYAPVYASHLTALTRVKLLEAADSVEAAAYAGGHTDSVLSAGGRLSGLGDGLGAWKLEKSAPRAEVSKTGMYAMIWPDHKTVADKCIQCGKTGDLPRECSTVKLRGITKNAPSSFLWADSHTRNARTGIKTAKTWDDVSVILPKKVANNYTIEQKRVWDGPVTRALLALDRYVDSEALGNVA